MVFQKKKEQFLNISSSDIPSTRIKLTRQSLHADETYMKLKWIFLTKALFNRLMACLPLYWNRQTRSKENKCQLVQEMADIFSKKHNCLHHHNCKGMYQLFLLNFSIWFHWIVQLTRNSSIQSWFGLFFIIWLCICMTTDAILFGVSLFKLQM